jgi:hypothetical protein
MFIDVATAMHHDGKVVTSCTRGIRYATPRRACEEHAPGME